MSLDLDQNSIRSIESGDFAGLSNLWSLDLGGNSISSIESNGFAGLENLEVLIMNSNSISSIEPNDFAGLPNLISLDLGANSINRIEAGDFAGLENLPSLILSANGLTSIEPRTFAGFRNLRTLHIRGNHLTNLDLTGATFENLQPPRSGISDIGFWVDSSGNSRVESLVLDEAQLSEQSFAAIVGETSSIVEASLVGLTFTDANPSDFSALLGIPTLNNVTVDSTLFGTYEAEFNAFAAMPGNTVSVVPERTTAVLLSLAFVAGSFVRKRRVDMPWYHHADHAIGQTWTKQ